MKKGDFLSIAAVCLACALWFFFTFEKSDRLYAEVYFGGEQVKEISLFDLAEPEIFTVGGCVIKAENGAVSFFESDCPDGLCKKTGALKKPGDTAACVPNRVVVCVKGESKNKFDIVTY